MKARHEFESDQAYTEYLKHYYAGQAMQGMLSISYWSDREYLAELAIMHAHALIKALNENKVK